MYVTLLNRVFRVGLIEKVRCEPSPKEVRHMDLCGKEVQAEQIVSAYHEAGLGPLYLGTEEADEAQVDQVRGSIEREAGI